MEEGGGHGFFLFWLLFFGGGGGGRFFFLWVLLFVFLLVGWLAGGVFFPSVLFKAGIFLVSTFSYHAGCGYAFFFFFFLSLFFLVELEGWLDYASPGRAD